MSWDWRYSAGLIIIGLVFMIVWLVIAEPEDDPSFQQAQEIKRVRKFGVSTVVFFISLGCGGAGVLLLFALLG